MKNDRETFSENIFSLEHFPLFRDFSEFSASLKVSHMARSLGKEKKKQRFQ